MAAFPICYKTRYKDQNLPIHSVVRQNDQRSIYRCVDMLRSFSSIPSYGKSCCFSLTVSENFIKSNPGEWIAPRCLVYGRGASLHKIMREIGRNYSKRDSFPTVWCSSEHSSNEKQLRSLESYFQKLHGNTRLSSFDSSNKVILVDHRDGQSRLKGALESLDAYLVKLNNESYRPSTYTENFIDEDLATKLSSTSRETERNYQRQQNTYADIRRTRGENGPRMSTDPQQPDETCSLYLIGILASINIAVFLFEIASPIRNSDLELFSLPLLYGAKINDLIVIGEWWRLVTPMFLHSGILHMALSCWALVSFGPQVCKGYGSFTFLLIYVLGGVSGNLTSFLHTPEPTVGGTGPVFAIIGAWLAYQIQNRDVTGNDTSETMFQKALIVTALGFLLSNFGPIDEWTHFGAAFTGMAYGFFTSPILQLDDASSGSGREEGLKLVRQYGDSCKSLIVFAIFIVILSSFLFFIEPPLSAQAFVSVVYMSIVDATYWSGFF